MAASLHHKLPKYSSELLKLEELLPVISDCQNGPGVVSSKSCGETGRGEGETWGEIEED